ncbi:DUF3489 domain-containing protein [Sphingomonas sp.]|uniref:DUF3489 domain-containing protein n=1 Tax=Sphingomonas sp. TaxID=28214 RepID=UPI00182F594E|nr:DUF3489 domain-containing protein [Sphingomonas sp.]MBA3511591.1 DUF3489 domain-containing protein [Sphingomonas sp.]
MTKTKKTESSLKATAAKASNKDKLLELLRRAGGASLVEITEVTGWLPHSARAMLTGLRKKSFVIGKEKVEGTTRYSIANEPAA